MSVVFLDRQWSTNPLNGTEVGTEGELAKLIDRLAERAPFFCELVGTGGYQLLMGLAKRLGVLNTVRPMVTCRI